MPAAQDDEFLVNDPTVLITCENVHKTYLMGTEGVAALRGVSMDVYKGEFVVIYGTSGGGKTTLLNILGTIDTATKGNVVVMGKRVTSATSDSELARLRLEKVGFVFQSFNLLSTMSAMENVEMPMILLGKRSASERTDTSKALLTSVGLGHRLDHLPSQMSGGEQQRATIARALANDPMLLLMDEPTGDLDSKNTALVLDILTTLNREQGITIVMVSHDPYMKNYAHRAVYVRDGKVNRVETTDPRHRRAELERLHDEAEKIRIGATASSNGDEDEAARRTFVVEKRAATDYGRISTALRPASTAKSNNPFMNARVLNKLFGTTLTKPTVPSVPKMMSNGAAQSPATDPPHDDHGNNNNNNNHAEQSSESARQSEHSFEMMETRIINNQNNNNSSTTAHSSRGTTSNGESDSPPGAATPPSSSAATTAVAATASKQSKEDLL
eukprot:PhM_4_TR18685/c0_g1_i3/m.46389/K02003/ABC.CD.A; putative ABC transport system ATP-binding protein